MASNNFEFIDQTYQEKKIKISEAKFITFWCILHLFNISVLTQMKDVLYKMSRNQITQEWGRGRGRAMGGGGHKEDEGFNSSYVTLHYSVI